MNTEDKQEILRGMAAMEARLSQRMDDHYGAIRREIQGHPRFRSKRRVWMGIGEYRLEFLNEAEREEWSYHRILGRVEYTEKAREGRIRARKAGPKRKALQIRVKDADNVIGFE